MAGESGTKALEPLQCRPGEIGPFGHTPGLTAKVWRVARNQIKALSRYGGEHVALAHAYPILHSMVPHVERGTPHRSRINVARHHSPSARQRGSNCHHPCARAQVEYR